MRSITQTSIFTTGQVATICKVAPHTVSKWFDSGRLRGYRIPGSQDRRIPREHLIRFLTEHGMPLGELEASKKRIVFVGSEEEIFSQIHGKLESFEAVLASNEFDAGMHLTNGVGCIVIDCVSSARAAVQIATSLKEHDQFAHVVTIALVERDQTIPERLFTGVFRKPFDPALLAEQIRTLVERREKAA